MQKISITLCFSISAFFYASALTLKNDTNQPVAIISFTDAQGWEFHYAPHQLKPKQIVDIQNVSCKDGEYKSACLERLTMVTQTDAKKHAFILHVSAKDLKRMYSGFTGLTLGIPKTKKTLRKYYELQEKFPGQLNIRMQNISSMKKC